MNKALKRMLICTAIYIVGVLAIPTFLNWQWVPPSEWSVVGRGLFLFGLFWVGFGAFVFPVFDEGNDQ